MLVAVDVVGAAVTAAAVVFVAVEFSSAKTILDPMMSNATRKYFVNIASALFPHLWHLYTNSNWPLHGQPDHNL